MKAFIYTGGSVDKSNITEHPKSDDLCIAADAGYANALALNERVDIVLGDFDSYTSELPEKIEKIQVPAEKDFTDTQLAVKEALARGATEIVIIGGLGGRLDHTLSNISVLAELWKLNVHAVITDGVNRIRYINSSSTLIAKSGYKYVSVIAISEKLKGVDIEGCKYPLKNAVLQRSNQYAVSNEIVGNCALIAARKGEYYVIESRDKI